MTKRPCNTLLAALLLAALSITSAPLLAQQATAAPADAATSSAQWPGPVSPEAQAVVDRMTAYLKTVKTFSIDAQITRDEVVQLGYKLQHNQHSIVTVQSPNKLRSESTGDIRDRTSVYDGSKLTMYSPDDNVYVRVDAPDSLGKLVSRLLDLGVDMPLMDVLYQAHTDSLTADVEGGILIGDSTVDGVDCDQVAFRQMNIDWQIWVEQGARPLLKKILITTRFEVGDPQYQAILRWNLQPKIDSSTFVFTPPKGATEIPFANPPAAPSAAQ